MACEALHTGARFLAASLANLDCQGRTIGSSGYGSLAAPGSVAASVISGFLALFVALWGVRLLVGEEPRTRDLVGAGIKVGLFLTLATSWPAWRVIGYDLVLDGPAEIASAVGIAAGLPGASNDLVYRLQDADTAIVTLTAYGSGRLSNAVARSTDVTDSASAIALSDQSTLGWGRSLFLISAIGTYGLARLGAGLLLALAPLIAGFLLFSGTNPIFLGWLRALGFCALASVVFQIAMGAELAMLNPWMSEVLQLRQENVLAASAPTELFVLTGAFALALAGTLALIARMLFMPPFMIGLPSVLDLRRAQPERPTIAPASPALVPSTPVDRAALIVNSIENSLRRENTVLTLQGASASERAGRAVEQTEHARSETISTSARQGDRYRRSTLRTSQAGRRRDQA